MDGPGIRFVVFFQGCPLRCLFCHNRDTWDARGGQETTVEALMRDIRKYKSYMKFSKGGVTASGGEPLRQPEFLRELLRQCRQAGIHTAVDTSGYADLARVETVFEVTDLVLLDLKSLHPATHTRLTGVDVTRILDFARHVSGRGVPIWIRHVLVPGWTDSPEHLRLLGEFVATLKSVEAVEILPFHQMGAYKWNELGCGYALRDVPPPTKAQVRAAMACVRQFHPTVR